ncbi:precorrin-6A reductase [Priestia sp. Y58]|uniref:precorrin-6A reductase n=1 Tax=Priestia TaxID=2800373 RepID=UPI0022B90CB2|nr:MULTISPECIES: precorrin-6A reductase [Priestia]MCZ8493785.1 precorrin-6A reductase [Priestia megaterium]MDG0031906.1 precorrin-6A reductase [Priestia sp. Y58]
MILLLAGTSDARALAVQVKKAGHEVTATVVTENAAIELQRAEVNVKIGRLTKEDMMTFINGHGVKAIVDASHPFAEEASKNAIGAAAETAIPYIRYERASQAFAYDNMTMVSTYEEAAEVAAEKKGVIMLTTGSKTLQVFTEKLLPLSDVRLVARMLPRLDNMEKCQQLGFPQKNIIAIQGPFTKEFDRALYKQYGVTVMVTKESGKVGSVDEKVEAAKELGLDIIMIGRPKIEYGTVYSTFEEVVHALANQTRS